MSKIKFSPAELQQMVDKLQGYFAKELDIELEQFDSEFLIDFISEHLGGHYYNRGLHDARAIINDKLALIDDEIYAIEKEIN